MKTSSVLNNTTEETIEYNDLNSAIKREIETLPKTTRGIFILSRYNGFTNPEIAKQYCLSIKSVEYHLTKALKHLRLHLKHV
jgi:RNA polymerase sigma-70 factor (ECF subfamily)